MRIIVGISGASGAILGYELLKALAVQPQIETHLIITDGAKKTFACETDLSLNDITDLADVVHNCQNMAASISSGSFRTDGLIIVPCSMKTVAGIVAGFADNLLLRAADVCLKEGRKVVLVPREMPLSRIHLRNLQMAADYGCRIIPPMLTFYNNADSVQKQINHIIGKILCQFNIESSTFIPWKGEV